jgi:GTP cyclohydrolase I
MDALSTPRDDIGRDDEIQLSAKRPTRDEAEAAVRTLIAWAGDDPRREGLIETPKRVVDAYGEWFAGYTGDAAAELTRTFEDVQGYDDIVLLRGIDVTSFCEHHMAPFLGKATVAYLPRGKVVGLSKLARVVEVFARRLQTQETLTRQVADAIVEGLNPLGVAVLITAEHQCMSTRGVRHQHVDTVTTTFTGVFKTDAELRSRFMGLAKA